MRSVALVIAALGLTACGDHAKRTSTVDELAADETLLADMIADCRNNPGDLANTPNCRNAEAAVGKLQLERMQRLLGG